MGSDNVLWVCFTMDVERVRKYSPPGGPEDWASAQHSARSYCDLLLDSGYPVTLFIVPEAAEEQSALFRTLAGEGHECALHIHPQSWKDHWKEPDEHDYFGGYGPREQREMLRAARDQWAQALGFLPKAFRPGNFSANDDTFHALVDTGFTHGSVSEPERLMPDCKADWRGACRHVRRASAESRLVPGELDFVEVPLTVDPDERDDWTGTGDIRFEGADAEKIIRAAGKEIGSQIDAQAPLKHLCFFTHNFVQYWPDGEPRELARLKEVVAELPRIAGHYGLVVNGAVLRQVREAFVAGCPSAG